MNSWAGRIPAGEVAERAREIHPGRVAMTAITLFFRVLAWAVFTFFRVLGWLAGKACAIAVDIIDAVTDGFRAGAGLPPPEPPGEA